MRILVLAIATVLTAAALGCGRDNRPVAVTPEMEAEQKQADAKVRDEESTHQRTQKLTGKPTAEDEEAARARRGN